MLSHNPLLSRGRNEHFLYLSKCQVSRKTLAPFHVLHIIWKINSRSAYSLTTAKFVVILNLKKKTQQLLKYSQLNWQVLVTFPNFLLTVNSCVFHQLRSGWNGLLSYGAGWSAQEIPGTHQSPRGSTEGRATDRGLQVRHAFKSWVQNHGFSSQTNVGSLNLNHFMCLSVERRCKMMFLQIGSYINLD